MPHFRRLERAADGTAGVADVSAASRALKVGDYATTDFNGPGSKTRVQIVARLDGSVGQSRVSFKVRPALNNSTPDCWIDADWFEPYAPGPGVDIDRAHYGRGVVA